jgi:hypothetical protein
MMHLEQSYSPSREPDNANAPASAPSVANNANAPAPVASVANKAKSQAAFPDVANNGADKEVAKANDLLARPQTEQEKILSYIIKNTPPSEDDEEEDADNEKEKEEVPVPDGLAGKEEKTGEERKHAEPKQREEGRWLSERKGNPYFVPPPERRPPKTTATVADMAEMMRKAESLMRKS